MNLKTFSICLAANLFLFALPSFAQIPVRLDTQLRDPNGVILEYGVEDGSLHIRQLPDATTMMTLELESAIGFATAPRLTCDLSDGLFDAFPEKPFFKLATAGFSEITCSAGTLEPGLALDTLAAQLTVTGGHTEGVGSIKDAILVPEPSCGSVWLLLVGCVAAATRKRR